MDIEFSTKKLEKECNDGALLKRKHGEQRAKLIRRRLDEMRAAPNLDVLGTLRGPRCHELKGGRKGQLSVDLDHPYRLIFEVNQSPVPENLSGGLDWAKVTQIIVVQIADTHK